MRLVQALTLADKAKSREFCEEEDGFVRRLISDKATFHISGKVNVHSVCIWRTEQPHAQIEHHRDSKSNVLCGVAREISQPIILP
jgi:hypothetical protein